MEMVNIEFAQLNAKQEANAESMHNNQIWFVMQWFAMEIENVFS